MTEIEIRTLCLELAANLCSGGNPTIVSATDVVAAAEEFERYISDSDPKAAETYVAAIAAALNGGGDA